jgi:hypothetical protein
MSEGALGIRSLGTLRGPADFGGLPQAGALARDRSSSTLYRPHRPHSLIVGALLRGTGSRLALVALCVIAPVVEASLSLVLLHAGSVTSLAPQASAVAPLGVFQDMRWLFVYASSWPTFAALSAGFIVLRGAISALSVRLAWPMGAPLPDMRRLLLRGIAATAVAGLLLVPSTTLLFAMAVVPVSWFFLAAVPLALGVSLVVYPTSVRAGWWQGTIPLRGLGWVVADFGALTLSSAALASAPVAVAFAVLVLAGAFNARAWAGMVAGIVRPSHFRHPMPVVPLALAALAVVVVLGSVWGLSRPRPTASPMNLAIGTLTPAHGEPGEQTVLIVGGYGSQWDGEEGHPVPGRFFEERFSYRGLGHDGQPLPYTSSDTVKPLADLDELMAAQVAKMSRESGRQVDIVAESEGALVAQTYLISYYRAPVSDVVLASPLIGPGRVSYPTGPFITGKGVAGGYAMALLANGYQSVASIDLSARGAFLASVDDLGSLLPSAADCPTPRVRTLALLPLADAVAAPQNATLPFASIVLPAFHGGLIETASADRLIGAELNGKDPTASPFLSDLDRLIGVLASAWQEPTATLARYPAALPPPKALALSCSRLAHALRAEAGGKYKSN